jgi:hypothetical protein
VFTSIIELLTALLGLSDHFSKVDKDQRERAAKFLLNVSDCVSRMVTDFRQGIPPISACSEFKVYCENLPGLIRQRLPEQQLTDLQEMLLVVDTAPMRILLASEARDISQEQLAILEAAIGRLRGLSISLEA